MQPKFSSEDEAAQSGYPDAALVRLRTQNISFYVDATAANAIIIVAPEFAHMNIGNVANLESYNSQLWFHAKQVAHFSTHSFATMFRYYHT